MEGPTASAWTEGTVVRVLWAAEDGGWAVLRLMTGDGEITAVGPLAGIGGGEGLVGSFVSLDGRWEDHAAHGRQFRAIGYLEGNPRTIEGIKLYLEGVPGIGPKLAGRIVDAFGIETIGVLSRTPWRLREVKGVKSKAAEIAERWQQDEAGRALTIRLRGLGLPPRLIERIRRRYGDRARAIVEVEPYRLAEEITGIGFRTADALARAAGLPEDAPGRIRAAILHVIEPENTDGDCFLDRVQTRRAIEALGVPGDGVDAAIDGLARDGRVVVESVHDDDALIAPPADPADRVWPTALYTAEVNVARALRERIAATYDAEEGIAEEIAAAEAAVSVSLAPLQREAVKMALRGGPIVITGGPGTGKTTLVRVLLRVATRRGRTVRLASPTGRAAKRIEEATGAPAATLHRLLEFNPGEGGFQRNGGQPIEGDVLVVDEVSMIDLPLMSALLDALPADLSFPLVLVGDADQLPSVGPGRILGDLIASGRIPVVRLEHVYRQAARSGILDAATRIHAGEVPISGELAGFDDVYLVPRDAPERALDAVLQIAAERLPAKGFDPRADVQILAPTRKGPLGTEALNRALQARLNPDGRAIKRGDREFRVGDRVLCTKNRYDLDVFNGDVGAVIGGQGGSLEIAFDGRPVVWAPEDLHQIDLAYAMTVHKAQGSEYPAVVLALHSSHGLMLRRNLFYTAATRAKRFLCVVGSPRAWERAAHTTGGQERQTRLAERISEASVRFERPLDADVV